MSGLEVSRRDLLERQQVQLLLRDEPFQLRILLAERLEFLGLVDVHVPVPVTPVVIGRLGNVEMAGDLLDRLAVGQQPVHGLKLPNDLVGSMPFTSFRHDDVLALPGDRTPTLRGTKYGEHARMLHRLHNFEDKLGRQGPEVQAAMHASNITRLVDHQRYGIMLELRPERPTRRP